MIHSGELLSLAIEAAEAASIAILEVYHSDNFEAEAKADQSPLTLADKNAHRVIVDKLRATGLPILSEEGKSIPYTARKDWQHFWMVDPLDGTKEFIKRNGEFTVNIALISGNTPILGVVAVPVTGEVYSAVQGEGAFLKTPQGQQPLPKRNPVDLKAPGLRVVASRSHMDKETEAFIACLDNPSLISSGSSLKFMLLASGKADVYPRFAPTMEWDTAAAHAVANAAGIRVFQQGKNVELSYNKVDLLNPYFLCY